jgi:hypothetical protein
VRDLLVVFVRELLHGQESFFGVEGKVAGVVVGKVVRVIAIADDEELHEAKQRSGIAVAGIILVLDDLLHGHARIAHERLEFDLSDRDAIDQQNDVIAVVAVVCVDAELVDDFEMVLAPVFDVDQREVQRRAIVAGEGIDAAQGLGSDEDICRDDFVEQPGKLGIRQTDAIERFEFLAEVLFQCRAIANVWTNGILEAFKSSYKRRLDILLPKHRWKCFGLLFVERIF